MHQGSDTENDRDRDRSVERGGLDNSLQAKYAHALKQISQLEAEIAELRVAASKNLEQNPADPQQPPPPPSTENEVFADAEAMKVSRDIITSSDSPGASSCSCNCTHVFLPAATALQYDSTEDILNTLGEVWSCQRTDALTMM